MTVNSHLCLQSWEIIFIGKLFDEGYTATFSATHMRVEKKGLIFLEGHWKEESGVWQVNLTTTPHPNTIPTC